MQYQHRHAAGSTGLHSTSSREGPWPDHNQDDYTQKQLQVIMHYPDQGDDEYTADTRYGESMSCTLLIYVANRCNCCQILLQIPSRFCCVSFVTEKLNGKHREEFASMSFVPDKE